jgi:hypothetical protein
MDGAPSANGRRQAARDLTSYTPKPQQATGLRAAEGNLMVDHNVGVTVSQKYEVKRLDVDYFEAE